MKDWALLPAPGSDLFESLAWPEGFIALATEHCTGAHALLSWFRDIFPPAPFDTVEDTTRLVFLDVLGEAALRLYPDMGWKVPPNLLRMDADLTPERKAFAWNEAGDVCGYRIPEHLRFRPPPVARSTAWHAKRPPSRARSMM